MQQTIQAGTPTPGTPRNEVGMLHRGRVLISLILNLLITLYICNCSPKSAGILLLNETREVEEVKEVENTERPIFELGMPFKPVEASTLPKLPLDTLSSIVGQRWKLKAIFDTILVHDTVYLAGEVEKRVDTVVIQTKKSLVYKIAQAAEFVFWGLWVLFFGTTLIVWFVEKIRK